MAKILPAVKTMEREAILITSANSGVGLAAAKELISQGHSVYGATRRIERMAPLTEYGVHTIELDITGEKVCGDAVGQVIIKRKHIDVLVNSMGYGSYEAIEDIEIDETRRQFDVSVFGLAALMEAVLLHMRERRSGMIVDISSIGGRLVSFIGGWYHAAKYAVETPSNALRTKAAEFGISIVLIKPGGIKTEWADIAAGRLAKSSKGRAYGRTTVRMAEGICHQYSDKTMSNPDIVAWAILWTINTKWPRLRYLVDLGAKPLVAARAMLPTKAFDWVMRRAVLVPSWQKPRYPQQCRPR